MNMERPWIIYTLADPRNGEVRYVGMTFRRDRRFIEHLSKARRGGKTHRDCWIRSLLSIGLSPTVEIIAEGRGEGWQKAERIWISAYRETDRLVNHTDGGDGTPGCIPSTATREIWSRNRKGVPYAPGRIPGMKGKHHTPETRAKIAGAWTGRKHSPESKAKMSAARKGKPIPDHVREALVAARTGCKLTPEHRAKIAAATTGRKPVLCVETGTIYPSITAASKALGVTEPSVGQAIRKGCCCKGNHYQFA